MNVLVIGAGGREHALCWAIAKSPRLATLYCAPGNGGIGQVAACVALDVADHAAVISFCRNKAIDLVVIGPEAPLVAGLADDLDAQGIAAFGPSAKAAQLEGSKGFTKDLCAEYSIPTAAFGRFTQAGDAKAYIRQQGAPIVVKADGLAAGKGVIIAQTEEQAEQAVDEMFAGRFGEAGAEVVIEQFLTGEEASFFALVDGQNILPLETAQDHKRVGDKDTGPNTGGMGAYSPAPVMDEALCRRTMKEIIEPTVKAMNDKGMPYKGVLYAGLMITDAGPQLIEYNVRFGDPECQVLMMRIKSGLLEALLATAQGTLDQAGITWHDDVALTVVMAAKGYPGAYDKGAEIKGIDQAEAAPDVEVFHAGTRADAGRILAAGGRVLNVTALGPSVSQAQARAYRAAGAIDWADGFHRSDIGWRAVERERSQAAG
jgi:phosphoribosylamine--glycine ligase